RPVGSNATDLNFNSPWSADCAAHDSASRTWTLVPDTQAREWLSGEKASAVTGPSATTECRTRPLAVIQVSMLAGRGPVSSVGTSVSSWTENVKVSTAGGAVTVASDRPL